MRIYRDAAQLYERAVPSLGEAALGYEVLYGPPVCNPPVLFVGYQPGGRTPEPLPGPAGSVEQPPWPATIDYARVATPGAAEQPFLLARRLQVAFGAEFLGGCAGMNAIFLRSPSMDSYAKTVPADVRAEYEALGAAATRELVELLRPRIVVALGFVTMRLFASDANVVLRGEGDRALLSSAEFSGRPLFGMRHPSGAKPPASDADMARIGAYLLRQLEPAS